MLSDLIDRVRLLHTHVVNPFQEVLERFEPLGKHSTAACGQKKRMIDSKVVTRLEHSYEVS